MEHCLRPVVAAFALIGGCAAAQMQQDAPDAPGALRPPAGEVLSHALHAEGVQVYECSVASGRSGGFDWVFKGPEAVLTDGAGRAMGRHYGGPTWEAPDGSAVVGKVKARVDSPDPQAIPWLLLGAEPAAHAGAFSAVRSIQRLQTVGGKAPGEPCVAERAGHVARVPYRSVYYFYRTGRAVVPAESLAVAPEHAGLFPNEMMSPAAVFVPLSR